jgi:hypothetical protein
MPKYIFLDSEFNGTAERDLNVICFALVTEEYGQESFWLYNNEAEKIRFKAVIEEYIAKGYVFVSYAVEAEARAFLSLGIDPLRMKWIDLYLEYVMLSNHNNEISKGDQLINGKVKKLPNMGFEKGKKGLSAALFKLCKIIIDTDHKNKMRDLIISSPEDFTREEATDILNYCMSDTEHLPKLHKAINATLGHKIKQQHRKNLLQEQAYRAEYAVRSAMMIQHGYPVNLEWLRNLTDNIPVIMRECVEDINSQFPDILPFRWNKKECRYSLNTAAVTAWIENSPYAKKWERTDTGKYSLALDAWKNFFNYSHDYPRNNFGAQFVRYLNFSQQLKGFREKSGESETTFWDYVGSDGMVRSSMGIYGAQSSRSQQKSTSFLFLKSGWMRSLCAPPEGYCIGAIDYGSQEFLLSALMSKDKKMIQAYAEGDVYLYYAKGIGLVPPHGTKETHSKERDLCKATVLGLSYLMTEHGLSRDLSEKLGREVTVEEAKGLVDSFYELFSTFSEWRASNIENYPDLRYVRLPDGFHMFGDNPNFRSVGNMPIQGFGACIMRKAVQLAQNKGLNIIFTLHDQLFIMFRENELENSILQLKESMKEAFMFYFEGDLKEKAAMVKLDCKAWGPSLEEGKSTLSDGAMLVTQKNYVDPRATDQYKTFSKYFLTSLNLELL